MKKILLILVAFLGISLNTSAKDYARCVINGGGGASVTVTVVECEQKDVSVTLSSDCAYPVSVTFYFRFYVKDRHVHGLITSQSFTVTVPAGQDTPKKYTLRDSKDTWGFTEISSIADVVIDGARCIK